VNEYEQKVEGRYESLMAQAENARKQAKQYRNRASSISMHIPFGQPILVGHHSEKRHRRDADRISSYYHKANELDEKAKELEAKAVGVGSAGISSDDPEALVKLREKLGNIEQKQERMKLMNRAHKAYRASLKRGEADFDFGKYGLTDGERQLVIDYVPDRSRGGRPFPPYELTNNNARIRSTRKRLRALEAETELRRGKPDKEVVKVFDGGRIVYNYAINRVQIVFDERTSKEAHKLLRSRGFVFSRSNVAYQRKLNRSGRYYAKDVVKQIAEMGEGQS